MRVAVADLVEAIDGANAVAGSSDFVTAFDRLDRAADPRAVVAQIQQQLRGLRLHVRAIVRDRKAAFVGSQSLRKLELDKRREVGLITKDRRAVAQIARLFEQDWKG